MPTRTRPSRPNARATKKAAVPPLAPRSAKGAKTRARLLEAAKKVFERDGFLNARITDIADTAGVSHGSFYHYFESKEQIFREVAEAQEVSLLSVGSTEDAPPDPVERIRAANRDYLEAYLRSAKFMKVVEEVSRYDDEVRLVRTRRDDEFARRLEASINRQQQEGLADPRIDGWYAANILGCMVARFAEMIVRNGGYDVEKAIDQLTLIWANGIGLPADNRRARSPRSRR